MKEMVDPDSGRTYEGPYLVIPDISRFLGVDRSTVRRWITTGVLFGRQKRPKGLYFVPHRALMEFIDSRYDAPSARELNRVVRDYLEQAMKAHARSMEAIGGR